MRALKITKKGINKKIRKNKSDLTEISGVQFRLELFKLKAFASLN